MADTEQQDAIDESPADKIPDGITRDDVLRAIADFDGGAIESHEGLTHYGLYDTVVAKE